MLQQLVRWFPHPSNHPRPRRARRAARGVRLHGVPLCARCCEERLGAAGATRPAAARRDRRPRGQVYAMDGGEVKVVSECEKKDGLK